MDDLTIRPYSMIDMLSGMEELQSHLYEITRG